MASPDLAEQRRTTLNTKAPGTPDVQTPKQPLRSLRSKGGQPSIAAKAPGTPDVQTPKQPLRSLRSKGGLPVIAGDVVDDLNG